MSPSVAGIEVMVATTFRSLHIAIVTVSDTRTVENDGSGNLLAERASEAGHNIAARRIVRDDITSIVHVLRELTSGMAEVVITTGGTGLTGRDVTPEALEQVCDKMIPGFGELFRYLSFKNIGTATIQSRATAGIANGRYIFALPGSTGACRDAWDQILKHQLDASHKPCNFAELIPRLLET
jgi:molybdopterin adenylyltransferase